MSLTAALGLVLFQAAAATPAPTTAPTPTPTPRPAAAGPRTLQDFARERRLATTKAKGSVGTISVGPSTASAAPAKTPGAAAAASEAPTPAPTPPEPSGVDVRVVSVTNDGIVDGAGVVRVNGTIRNAGFKPVCNIVIGVKILDNKGFYLASGQTAPDVNLLASGETSSFHALVQAPPGVRGARTNPDRRDVSEGSTSMGGDWKLLGGSEASVLSASEECPR